MYGTIARIKVKPGAVDSLKRLAEKNSAATSEGYLGQYVYQMDNDPNELYLAVIYESKESYRANANSPKQNERFQEMKQYFAAKPDWRDGEVIFSHTA